jgi:hypothetical protein
VNPAGLIINEPGSKRHGKYMYVFLDKEECLRRIRRSDSLIINNERYVIFNVTDRGRYVVLNVLEESIYRDYLRESVDEFLEGLKDG